VTTTQSPRSVLFFPGTRPDRYGKALASGADVVCLDLEDAVAEDEKHVARDHAARLVSSNRWEAPRAMIRINHPASPDGREDLRAILAAAAAGPLPLRLMLPKTDGPGDLDVVRRACAAAAVAVRLVPVIETARGLAEVERIAAAEGVDALLFGGADLSVDLGCALAWEPLLFARSRMVHAAALGRVAALDVPFFDVRDPDALRAEARAVRRLGFTGKAAVHPDQIRPIHEAFTPTEEEVRRAIRVLEAVVEHGGGAALVDGSMVDRPVVEAARRTLARAGVVPPEEAPRQVSRSQVSRSRVDPPNRIEDDPA